MSQKKPTTNQQLEEMRAMIANLEPGKVVTLDRELQERNTTLMLMLYGAVAKYGIGVHNNDTGVLVTAQVPVLRVPANQSLQWEVSEDDKSVMLYIVLNEDVPVEGRSDKSETSSANVGDTAVGEVGATEETPPPAPTPSFGVDSDSIIENERRAAEAEDGGTATHEISDLIGDEFEDEIKVGLDGD